MFTLFSMEKFAYSADFMMAAIENEKQIQIIENDTRCHYHLTGSIERGDLEKIKKYNEQEELKWKTICLDSPGGYLNEAILIAKYLIENYIGTRVDSGASCLSACAWVFMAGSTAGDEDRTLISRSMHPNGKLGFHAPSLTVPESVEITPNIISKSYNTAINTIAKLVEDLFISNDINRFERVKYQLFLEFLKTPSEKIFYIDDVEKAGRWSIRIDPIKIEVKPSKEFLFRACLNASFWNDDKSAVKYYWDGEESFKVAIRDKYAYRLQIVVNPEYGPVCDIEFKTDSVGYIREFDISLDGNRIPAYEFGGIDKRLILIDGSLPIKTLAKIYIENNINDIGQESHTCVVMNSIGSVIDREICSIENSEIKNRKITYFIWPSGAKSVLDNNNGKLLFNGSEPEIVEKYSWAHCYKNSSTGNTFCHD